MIKNREAAAKELGGELVSIILKMQDNLKTPEYEVLMEGIKEEK